MPTVTVQRAFELALAHHQAGRLAEAEALYRQILGVQPSHVDALHFLGVIAHQAGRHDLAVEWISRAVALDPDNSAAHGNLGEACRVMGRLDEAVASFRRAVQLKPDHALAHYNLGNAYLDLHRLDDAVAAYRRALELKPDYAEASSNLGVALAEQGAVEQAIAAYRRALELNPDYAEASNNLGVALVKQSEVEPALAAYHRALELRPGYADAHHNLGVALAGQGRRDEAIAAYRRAIECQPDLTAAHYHLGVALKAGGQLEEAAAAYRRALEFKPDHVWARNNLGVILAEQGHLDEAVAAYRGALEFQAELPETLNNLGNALKDLGRIDAALQCYEQAIALPPDNPHCEGNRLGLLNLHPDWTGPPLLAEHRRWNTRHAAPLGASLPPPDRPRDPARRLKIGYVSPDFRVHSVARFLLPLLEKHDHRQFEIFCYADVAQPDSVTERVRNHSDQWRDTVSCPDERLTEWIREDGIDLLVDLAGHTAGNRLLVFARKPAPIQVTWLGYANTTGLETMDYRLTDALADPPGETEAWYGESLFRLPQTAWCYAPPLETPAPAVRTERDDAITFGSLNALGKVTDPMLALWTRILHAVPGSRLLVKAIGLGSESARERVRSMITAAGIAPERLELRGIEQSPLDHLAVYGEIDIALDSFPAHGTTTTCETLWMNVPVVSLAGRTPASRVGVSILSNVGLGELVAQTEEEYVRIAVELANDLRRLRALQTTLRVRLQASPLMDAASFARNMEAAYRTMWRRWCAEEKS